MEKDDGCHECNKLDNDPQKKKMSHILFSSELFRHQIQTVPADCHVSVQHVLLRQAPPRGTYGRPRPPISLKCDPRDVFWRCIRARPSGSICHVAAATRW